VDYPELSAELNLVNEAADGCFAEGFWIKSDLQILDEIQQVSVAGSAEMEVWTAPAEDSPAGWTLPNAELWPDRDQVSEMI
jgi:hypothetical protein